MSFSRGKRVWKWAKKGNNQKRREDGCSVTFSQRPISSTFSPVLSRFLFWLMTMRNSLINWFCESFFLISWEDTNSLGLQRARKGRRQQLVCWRCQKVASEFCQEKSFLTDQCWQCWQLLEKCSKQLHHLRAQGGRPLHINSAFWLSPQSCELLLTHQN